MLLGPPVFALLNCSLAVGYYPYSLNVHNYQLCTYLFFVHQAKFY